MFDRTRDALGSLLGNLSGLSQAARSTGPSAGTLAAPQTDDLINRAKGFIDQANKVLDTLQSKDGGAAGEAFARDFLSTFSQNSQAIAPLGVAMQGGHLSLDESALRAALNQSPQTTLQSLGQLQQTLQAPIQTQQALADTLRQSYQNLANQAPQISRPALSVYQVQQQQGQVGSIFQSIGKPFSDLKKLTPNPDRAADSTRAPAKDSLTKPPADPLNRPPAPGVAVLASPTDSHGPPQTLFGSSFGRVNFGSQGFGGGRYGAYDGGA
jgi:hypothetical protein